MPVDLFTLKDLRGQMSKMRRFTKHSYAVVFTRTGIFLADANRRLTLEDALDQAVKCDLGDQDPEVIATSLDLRRLGHIELDRS